MLRSVEGAEQRADQAGRQRQAGAAQRLNAALDLRSDHRVGAQRGVEQVLAHCQVVPQHDVEQRDQHQEQREDRNERVVGDQRGQIARPVITELLPHRQREPQRRPAALQTVGPAQQAIKEFHHTKSYPPAGTVPS